MSKDSKGDPLIGAMCLDVPVLSSFMSEPYAQFSMKQKLGIKLRNIETNRKLLFYKTANDLRKQETRDGVFQGDVKDLYKKSEKKVLSSFRSGIRRSIFAPSYKFFLNHPKLQIASFLVIMAAVGAGLSFIEDITVNTFFKQLKQYFMDKQTTLTSRILCHIIYSVVLALIACFVTANFSPTAGSGSGIPEVKAILSGLQFPQFVTLRTLLAKLLGNMIAIASGMFIGRVGPVTAICFIACYLLMKHLPMYSNFLETESIKRTTLSFAAAVAMAATMHSPVGGVLFSIEVTSDVFLTQNYGKSFTAAAFSGFYFWMLNFMEYSPLGVQPSYS